jgi:phosphoketolase
MQETTSESATRNALSEQELSHLDAYWRAANYLSVGQIYLLDNPLLREPLKPEHIKPRLLGHWGTTPGLNFIYSHLNRIIKSRDLNVIYICGPGHGGPGMVANTYLEGTYSEVYPSIQQDADGLRSLFRQFSFPGGIPSHAAPETPGSIHEGGELGYSLAHAHGAAFDNPDLVVVCVVGDGEAERDRSPRPGTAINFSIRLRMAPYCRFFISTATRSPTRPSSDGCKMSSSSGCFAATGMILSWSRDRNRWQCTNAWPRSSTR